MSQFAAQIRGQGIVFTDQNPQEDGYCDIDTTNVSGFRFGKDIRLSAGANPQSDDSVVSKQYLESWVGANMSGLVWKAACQAATTANVSIASGLVTGTVIDGVTLATGNRVLVKSQSSSAENGIYVVSAGAATRSSDANDITELNAGVVTSILAGTINASIAYLQTSVIATLGTSTQSWTQLGVAAATTISQGDTSVACSDSGTGLINKTCDGTLMGCISAANGLRCTKAVFGSSSNSVVNAGRALEVVGEFLLRNSAGTGAASILAIQSDGSILLYHNSSLNPAASGTGWSAGIKFVSGGKLAIGTSIPSRPLEINSSDGLGVRQSYGASSGSATYYCDSQVSSAGYYGLLPSHKRVGVNTSSPIANLHIEGGSAADAICVLRYGGSSNYGTISSNTDGQLTLSSTASQPVLIEGGTSSNGVLKLKYNASANTSLISSNTSGYLLLQPSGNRTGINTSSPSSNLHVEGASGANAIVTLNYGGGSNPTTIGSSSAGAVTVTPKSGQAFIVSNGTGDTFSSIGSYLTAAGFLGSLSIVSSGGESVVKLYNASADYAIMYYSTAEDVILENSKLGSSVYLRTNNTGPVVHDVRLTGSGNVNNPANTATWDIVSDARTKRDIVYSDPVKALERLKKLKPAGYSYVWDPSKKVYGFIAQDLDSDNFSRMVSTERLTPAQLKLSGLEDIDYYSVNTSEVTPLIVSGLQALDAKVESLAKALVFGSSSSGVTSSLSPGKDGRDGLPGRDGVDGKDGAPGLPGMPGKDGVCTCKCKAAVDHGAETDCGYSPMSRLEDENVLLNKRLAALERSLASLKKRFDAATLQ